MAINNENEVLHRVRVKLHPNYLPNMEGAYIARTDNEASLSIEEVCAAGKSRGGFTGSYDDFVEHVHQFLGEAAYQLCDGFAVNVGGTFDKATEGHDTGKHPVTFRFRTRAPLRALAEHIVVEVEGLADSSSYIDEFIDVTTEAVNETLTPGGMFNVSGHKIKVAGDSPDIGVYFASTADPAVRVKVAGHLAENAASKLTGHREKPGLDATPVIARSEATKQSRRATSPIRPPQMLDCFDPLAMTGGTSLRGAGGRMSSPEA